MNSSCPIVHRHTCRSRPSSICRVPSRSSYCQCCAKMLLISRGKYNPIDMYLYHSFLLSINDVDRDFKALGILLPLKSCNSHPSIHPSQQYSRVFALLPRSQRYVALVYLRLRRALFCPRFYHDSALASTPFSFVAPSRPWWKGCATKAEGGL